MIILNEPATVREAAIQLAEERLVVIQPQRGIFVVKISVEDVLDAGFVREAIKIAFVATLAALAATCRKSEIPGYV